MESKNSNVDLALAKDKRAEGGKISKMQKALFKKANEISILCGIQIAIIILSIDRQPIVFGKPDAESVIHQFLEANHPTAPRFYMKMKKKEEENKEKGKSVEDNITHRQSEDYESPYLGSLLKLYEGLTEFENQLTKEIDLTKLNQEIEKNEDPKIAPEMNVASSSTLPTNFSP
ncbi:agamous-like MADS-box protein AGL62 [Solanum tuberosum]|uniref:Mads box protein n=1 Tax=Solanum tuberosum TaxID=4113 RepID=M1BPI5_SOLTU|nr:PREDICTED: agamous-like MADS-box protein AGL62 [Solanum tuberosum]